VDRNKNLLILGLQKPIEFQAWSCTPTFSALRRMRQEDPKIQASLGYMARPCLTGWGVVKEIMNSVNLNFQI
jgi:hypothetical protein